MELRHLRYFAAVAAEENVTRAAGRLHVSQPAVSRQIRDLEDELGVPLFSRTAQSLSLTPAGRVFLRETKAILERVDGAVEKARETGKSPRQLLNIGFSPSPTVGLLSSSLRAFQKAHPTIRVSLFDMTSCEMLEGMVDGRLHASLMVRPDFRAGRGLHFETLALHRVGVLLPAEHPLAEKKSVTRREVLNHPMVAYSRKEYPDYFHWVSRILGLKSNQWKIAEECDGITTLLAAVESGCGVAVVSESAAIMSGDRLHFVPLSPAPAPLEVGIAYKKSAVSPLLARFIESVRSGAGGPV